MFSSAVLSVFCYNLWKEIKKKDKIIESFLESKRTEIVLGEFKATVEDPTAHNELPKLISFLQLFKQAMIVGPTGSGKSTLAKQAAEAMQLRYGSFSCNMEASKSELVGFANLTGYITSQFLDFYENGGVFLIDEYDAMSPSIAVVLNAAFDRTGQISVPNRMEKPVAKKHKDFYCILAGNTWGSGSVEYQGREMQDMAFLDRFKLCRIFIDYDENIEKSIAGDHYEWMQGIRAFMNSHVESEKFSTRSVFDASTLLFNNFCKQDILNMITSHWDEELQKKLVKTVGV
jgi:energy-coupling factor transporter ATP-binding protein EcfA2